MPTVHANPFRRQHRRSRRRSQALRTAVLAVFSQPTDSSPGAFTGFSEQDWRTNLFWLDASGLALYLLDHLVRAGQETILPPSILERLQQNLVDNAARNDDLLHEAHSISRSLQREGVLFANLKGITLSPESVPDPALRVQLDLDFMIYAEHAPLAARVLEHRGYTLACISGDTWEFKSGQTEVAQLKDLYRRKPQRSAELHLTTDKAMLERVQLRSFGGQPLPVLVPADLYLQQALHLSKHLKSAFTRAAWVLELQRNMLAHQNDTLFWDHVAQRCAERPQILPALKFATDAVTEVLTARPLPPLERLVASHSDPAAELWIKLYSRPALLADFPGTKLYLLLQPDSERGKRLLPQAPPPPIAQRRKDETLLHRLQRRLVELRYLLFRLRFHLVEGLRYSLESPRFHRLLAGRSH